MLVRAAEPRVACADGDAYDMHRRATQRLLLSERTVRSARAVPEEVDAVGEGAP